jgi:hypothetical protein
VSSSVSSRSTTTPPSPSTSLRTEPTSAELPESSELSAIAGCQPGSPLKSRTRPHTSSAEAEITAML